MYDFNDTHYYDYFDYLNESADMDFLDFKEVMRREWLESHPKRSWFC
jgi:hypothetical protein